jgi:hypothetical protein
VHEAQEAERDHGPVRAYRMRRLHSSAAWEDEWSVYERYFRERQETALLLQPMTSASPPKWLLYRRGEFRGEFYSKSAAIRALTQDSEHEDNAPLPSAWESEKLAGLDATARQRAQMMLHRHYFTEPAPLSGFRRFYSIDPRFPFSIWYPAQESILQDASSRDRHVIEFGTFTVRRHSLVDYEHRWTGDPTIPVKVFGDQRAFVRYQFDGIGRELWRDLGYTIIDAPEACATVGSGDAGFRAPRVVGGRDETAFEWVFFDRESRPEVWIIARERQALSDNDFHRILASFAWLDLAFYRSLPILPHDFMYDVDPALLPPVSAFERPAEAISRLASATVAHANAFPHGPENAHAIMDGDEPTWIRPVASLATSISYVAPGVYYIRRAHHSPIGEERIQERAAAALGDALGEECAWLRRVDPPRYGSVLSEIDAAR